MDSENLMGKTWSRNMSSIQKIAYSDGAADGQESAYQTSFDLGFEQGLSIGLKLGSSITIKSRNIINNLQDTRKINCHICTNETETKENCGNLYNIQQEKNILLLKELEEQ